ncbi:MAG: methyltransferase type 11 [Bdellovibrionales bacterium RIFOXYC1_FULL_54_43]|nr:MAG: methyltransferase type 11 [Bdellovibrionales bacterium RIFOXYC1_FULL_54_43]OFZ79195.1 MAG: methyltransferase type 11 [Bdellovibrionales bacterium RIFOXYD1_FULL_55_31]
MNESTNGSPAPSAAQTTADPAYTVRLVQKQYAWWKRYIDVQAPYRWNLRRLKPGFTLEIGCGIGRNLKHLAGNGVGLDHNIHSVDFARHQGLKAFTPEDFKKSEYCGEGRFDSILLSHVAEHMTQDQLEALLKEYLPFLRQDGKIILITPQEVGYRSDHTHVEFMDFAKLRAVIRKIGFQPVREYSFPFPRPIGHLFIYNEFVVIGRRTRRLGDRG